MAQACRRLQSSGQPVFIWSVDQFADRDCVAASDLVSQVELDAVELGMFEGEGASGNDLLFVPGGGTENHSELIEQIAEKHWWSGIVGENLRAIREPEVLFRIAREVGLKTPPTYTHQTHPKWQSFADHPTDWLKNVELPKNVEWLWKSAKKGGGLGVSKVRTDEELRYFFSQSPFSQSPFSQSTEDYLQQFVPGTPLGATIIISSNGHARFYGACRLLTASDCVTRVGMHAASNGASIGKVETRLEAREDYPYLFSGAIGPVELPERVIGKLLQLAERSHHLLGVKGWFQVDFVLDALEEAWVLEVNPRWSATMEIYERAKGCSLLAEHLSAWGIETSAIGLNDRAMGKVCWKEIVYAEEEFFWRDSHQATVDALNAAHMEACGWPLIADIPMGEQRFSRGMPIFSVIASGSSEVELLEQRAMGHSVLR